MLNFVFNIGYLVGKLKAYFGIIPQTPIAAIPDDFFDGAHYEEMLEKVDLLTETDPDLLAEASAHARLEANAPPNAVLLEMIKNSPPPPRKYYELD